MYLRHAFRASLVTGAAVLLLAFSVVPASSQVESYRIDETLTTGLRRSIKQAREYHETTEVTVAGKVCTRTKASFWTEALTHEWHMDVQDAKARRVMRTFEKLKREREGETWIEITDNTMKTPRAVINDPRKGGIFVIDIAEDGTRTIHGETPTLIWDHDKRRIREPLEMDILPHKDVVVGESWVIAGEKCEKFTDREDSLLAQGADPEPFESGELTVSLESVETLKGILTAHLKIAGTLNYKFTKKAAYGDEEVTSYRTEVTVEGGALFNLAAGRMISRSIEATIKRSGKVDGMETSGTATFIDVREYRTAFIYEAAPDNGADDLPKGPVTELKTFPLEAVPANQLTLARNHPDGARIVTFDPETRKQVKTLCVLPAGKFIDHLSLAPTRDRIAFASTLNNEISTAPWNVFVLEIATGKLNQITPDWATGDGLAQPLAPSTGTVVGRVDFYDDFERATRSDDISGDAQLDQSRCHDVLGAGGSFKLENAPGSMLLLRIKARLPRPRHGVPRGVSVGFRDASVVIVVNVKAGEVTNVGTLHLSIGAVDMVYCNPTWRESGLMGHLNGSGMLWEANYPKRSFALDTKPTAEAWPAGFALNPKGEVLATTAFMGGKSRVVLLDPKTREARKTVDLETIGLSVQHDARLTWMESNILLGSGLAKCRSELFADCPALFGCETTSGDVSLEKTWPEWSGRRILDITLNADGRLVFITVSGKLPLTEDDRGELYCWDAVHDVTTRLTSSGYTLSVSNRGR